MPDSIRDDRREAKAEIHTAHRLRDAEYFRSAVNGLLGTIGNLTFPVDYIEGEDQSDIVATLKRWAAFSPTRVAEIAADDVLAMVNEGTM